MRRRPNKSTTDNSEADSGRSAEEKMKKTKSPAWVTKGKSIDGLIRELRSFSDQTLEVRLSFDDGATSVPVSLVEKSGGFCLLMNCEEKKSKTRIGRKKRPNQYEAKGRGKRGQAADIDIRGKRGQAADVDIDR